MASVEMVVIDSPKLRELAVKAGAFSAKEVLCWKTNHMILNRFNLELFAKLIIQEASEIAAFNPSECVQYTIRSHFGLDK